MPLRGWLHTCDISRCRDLFSVCNTGEPGLHALPKSILQLILRPGRLHMDIPCGAVSGIEDEKKIRRLPVDRGTKCIHVEVIAGYLFFFSRFACLFSLGVICGCFFFSLCVSLDFAIYVISGIFYLYRQIAPGAINNLRFILNVIAVIFLFFAVDC